MLNNKSGFTLIELLMVIVILGILVVVAIPRFIDLRQEASQAAEKGVAGSVKAGIQIAHAKRIVDSTYDITDLIGWTNDYPDELDAEGDGQQAGTDNPLFTYVLEQGIADSRWTKNDNTSYTYTSGTYTVTYTYTPASGTFTKP